MSDLTLAGDCAPAARREGIYELERFLLSQPQVALETRHYFADGLYARELRIPAGVALTGAVHQREHMSVVLKGKISVATEEGSRVLEAGQIVIAAPGSKRAGLALEDTVWVTFHATSAITISEAETELVTADHAGTPYSGPAVHGRLP